MSTMPCSSRYSARWKPSGSDSRMVSSITRCPAKPMTAPGSASEISPSIAKEAETPPVVGRSEEHTSELQSLMRISYAVFCLKKKKTNKKHHIDTDMTTL